MKYKNITTITIAVLVVILFFALLPQVVLVVGWAVSEHQETARSYPTRGTYYCQELETYLIFMDSSHTVQYADGSTDLLKKNALMSSIPLRRTAEAHIY